MLRKPARADSERRGVKHRIIARACPARQRDLRRSDDSDAAFRVAQIGSLRNEEDFLRVGIFHFGARRETADIDVILSGA